MSDRASGDGSNEEALNAFYSALLDDDAEALYERAPCGYLSTAPDGTIVKVNGTFLTWTGYDRADLIGRLRFVDLLTVGGRIYHETHYAPMLQMQGTAREIALDLLCADGRRLPALVNSVLERDGDGVPVVVRAAIFDATERRKYERELLRAKQRAEDSEAHAKLLARTLQQTLIPPAPPHIPGLDVAAAYRPAGAGDEVGGDFYDVFETGDDEWMVAVGDVCGKGVEAAVVTSLVRSTIRSAAVRHRTPNEVLDIVNAVLLKRDSDKYCTVALVGLRRTERSWTATVTCAGHPSPLLIRTGQPTIPVGQPDLLLGLFEAGPFCATDVLLQRGDRMLLYTDGVTEGRGKGSFYGEERLHAVIDRKHVSAHALVELVLQDVVQFQSGNPRDDIALVALGVGLSRQGVAGGIGQ